MSTIIKVAVAYFCIGLSLFTSPLLGGFGLRAATTVSEDALVVFLDETAEINISDSIFLALKNTGESTIRIANPNTTFGRSQLTFLFEEIATKKSFNATLTGSAEFWHEQDQKELKLLTIPKGETTWLEIPLFSDSRAWSNLLKTNSGSMFRIRVVLDGTELQGAKGKDLWRGQVRSNQISVLVKSRILETPRDYLANGKSEKVIDLIKANRSLIKSVDELGWTLLHYAAMFDDSKVLGWLLQNGADVNAIGNLGCTPLHMATTTESVGALLKFKPKLDLTNDKGLTPVENAAHEKSSCESADEKQKWSSVLALFKPHIAGSKNLMNAVAVNDVEGVKQEFDGTPTLQVKQAILQKAIVYDHVEIAKYIVDDFKLNLSVPELRRMASDAVNSANCLRLLATKLQSFEFPLTFKIYSTETNGSFLHLAVVKGNATAVKCLLDHGMNVAVTASCDKGKTNYSVIDWAAMFDKPDTLKAVSYTHLTLPTKRIV